MSDEIKLKISPAGEIELSIQPPDEIELSIEPPEEIEVSIVLGGKGEPGDPGVDGVDGAPGIQGPPGIDGINGIDGAPGAPGADGADGIDGVDGADGRDGSPHLQRMYEILGGGMRFVSGGKTLFDATTSVAMGSTVMYIHPAFIDKDFIPQITKFYFWLSTTGNFVDPLAGRENKAAVYQVNPIDGVSTKIAETANDPNIFRAAPGLQTLNLLSPINVSKDDCLYLALIYNNSSQVTAPQIACYPVSHTNTIGNADLPFSLRLTGSRLTGQLVSPASFLGSSQAIIGNNIFFAIGV